ncbi:MULTISPECIES: hypothetical protein [unclassified Pseudomonas]|uniref:hypothetical protein n=1 Tax=unclassified Pseudomonas TaxID=196821 RepID=UPI00128F89C0|nr:hypothetical protein [Pseudomonas sp. MN1F]MQG91558.1 hypothetical protein [Pseudomonas sp. MN1F]
MLNKFDSNSKKPATANATQEINEHNTRPILKPSAWGSSPTSHSPDSQSEFAEPHESNPVAPDFKLRGTFQSPLLNSAVPMAVTCGIYSYRLQLLTNEVLESLKHNACDGCEEKGR